MRVEPLRADPVLTILLAVPLSPPSQAEKGSSPGPNSQAQVPTYAAASHGTSGPIQTSFAPYMAKSFSAFFQALRARGKPAAIDLHSGANAGVNHAPSTINPSTRTRSYSVEYRASSSPSLPPSPSRRG